MTGSVEFNLRVRVALYDGGERDVDLFLPDGRNIDLFETLEADLVDEARAILRETDAGKGNES